MYAVHILMTIFLFVSTFVGVIFFFAYKMKRLEMEKKHHGDGFAADFEELKQRVATLEKIITSKHHQLRDEIENL